MKHLYVLLALLVLSPMSRAVAACETPGQFAAGDVVVINPGEPQNVRREPSVNAEQLFSLPAGEYLTVLDGPTCADGYNWWQVMYGWETGWTADAPAEGGEVWLSAPEMVVYEAGGIRFRAPESIISGVTWEDFDWSGGDGFDTPPMRVFRLEGYPLPEDWPEYSGRPGMRVQPVIEDSAVLLDEAEVYAPLLENALIVPFEAAKQGAFFRFGSGTGRRGVGYPYLLFPLSDLDLYISYGYRGITDDGKYEIGAGFPLGTQIEWAEYPEYLRGLADSEATEEDYAVYEAWVKSINDTLNEAPPDAFTPRLALLDAIVRSIEVIEPITLTPGSTG